MRPPCPALTEMNCFLQNSVIPKDYLAELKRHVEIFPSDTKVSGASRFTEVLREVPFV